MGLEIREACENDIRMIADFIEEIEKFYGSADAQPIDERVDQVEQALFGKPPIASALVVETETGTGLAAMAAYSYLWPAAGSTHSLFLKELFVSESYRSRGLGRSLVEKLLQIARERRGCGRVEWVTDADNHMAREFYQGLGVAEFKGKVFYRQTLPTHPLEARYGSSVPSNSSRVRPASLVRSSDR